MAQGDFFLVEQKDDVAWLTINRPKKHNAMDFDFFKGLTLHFKHFAYDPGTRVVIIKAAGRNFTAGTDLAAATSIIGGGAADDREGLWRKIRELQGGIQAIEDCCKPVIAAVHGYCIGGGVDMVCACDIRLAEKSSLFSIRETRMGIVADLGTLQRLPRIIGDGRCRELALTGRDFGAPEAHAMGLVTRVCDGRAHLYDEAEALARQIADNPPLTVQGVKDVINYSREVSVDDGLRYTAQKNAALLHSQDLFEAISAFKEKRKPRFKGK